MALPAWRFATPRSTAERLRVLLTPSTRLSPAVAVTLTACFLAVEAVLVVLIKQVDPRAPIGFLYAALMGIALVGNFWAGVAAVNSAAADRRRDAELAADLAHLMLQSGDLRSAADMAAEHLAAALGLRFARVELDGAIGDGQRWAIPLRADETEIGVLEVPNDLPRRTRDLVLRISPTFEALLAAARVRENINKSLRQLAQQQAALRRVA
jgi:hypothetical protein